MADGVDIDHDVGVENSKTTGIERDKQVAAKVAEAAWQLNQRFLHADYIGDAPDMFQLRRDLAELALLIHELAGGDVAEEPVSRV